MEVYSRHLDRVEEAFRTAVRLWAAVRLNQDRRRCYQELVARRSKPDRARSAHSAEATRSWVVAVAAYLFRLDQAEEFPMFRTESRSAVLLTRHRYYRGKSSRPKVVDSAVERRSKRGQARLASRSAVGLMWSKELRFRSVTADLKLLSPLIRPTRATCSEHWVAATRLVAAGDP